MTTEDTCPDCGRPFAETAHQQASNQWCMYQHSDGCARRTIARLRAELAEARARKFRTSRATVGPFTNSELPSRPILLETDDPALGQLRGLVNALGNWHDFAAFNEVVRSASRELSDAERAVVDSAVSALEAYHEVNAIYDREGQSPAYFRAEERGSVVTRQTAKLAAALLAFRAKKAGE